MVKTSKGQNRNKYAFNFNVYTECAEKLKTRIRILTREQIKGIQELESQADSALHDDRSCILPETPSQQRRRMFPVSDVVASSPLRDPDRVRPGFQSVIRLNGCEKITHFGEDAIRQRLCFNAADAADLLFLPTPLRVVAQPSTDEIPQKRKLRANNARCPPVKINNAKLKQPPTAPAVNTRSKRLKTAPKENTILKDATILKDTTTLVPPTKSTIEEKRSKMRRHAVEVELRRKAAEEERHRKFEQRTREDAEKETVRRKRLPPRVAVDKSSQFGSTCLKTPVSARPPPTPLFGASLRHAIIHSAKVALPTSTLAASFFEPKPVATSTLPTIPTSQPPPSPPTSHTTESSQPPQPQAPPQSDQPKEHENTEEATGRRNTFSLPKQQQQQHHVTPVRTEAVTHDLKSYNITPECVPPPKPFMPPLNNAYTCYDIASLLSGDSTDDERAPSKPIPKWAQDKFLWRAVVSQNKDVPINGDEVFGPIPPVESVSIFSHPSARFARRTSSAHWESSYFEESLSKA